jgi:predicted ribosome quality control (RQC) complex YloA/Tae2 family protein
MIQYYLDLENQAKAIKDIRLTGGQIQKIYSTAYYISMAIRTPGKTWHLYLGRGGGHEGLWLHDSPPPSQLRRKDNFLEYLRRHISSCSFLGLELDKYDRIVKLNYQKYGKVQSMLLFWKSRKLYFIHYYQESPEGGFKLLLSWRGKAITLPEEPKDLNTLFKEVGRREDLKHDYKSLDPLNMGQLLEDELKTSALKGLSQNPTFLQRKRDNIEDDLRKAQQWKRLQNMLDKGDSLEGYEIKIGDHKIKFEGELNPYERRNLVFQKIKKLKRGENILNERLQHVSEQLDGKVVTKVAANSTIPIIKPVWGKDEVINPVEVKKSEDDYRVFKNSSFQIGVGLSSHGNDQLRSRWAKKEDIWFHLDGLKSAHIIVKLLDRSLDSEIINTAASILAHFSHFNGEWIPVVYTQVKNLKGVTGAQGMVIYKKEKHLNCPKIDIDQWLKE